MWSSRKIVFYGDGVNIASRVESLGVAGAVLFTNRVNAYLKNHPEFQSKSLGKFHFKNVEEEIEVFALANEGFPIPQRKDMQGKLKEKKPSFSLLQKALIVIGLLAIVGTSFFFINKKNKAEPIVIEETMTPSFSKSVAILPFKNLAGDVEQDFFIEGIMDDILANLQKVGDIKVISRSSTKRYKDHTKTSSEIGKELRVAYLLEGSVRKSGNRVVISSQLNDTRNNRQVWADRYEKEFTPTNIFGVQANISDKIVEKLKINISPKEQASFSKISTKNPQAYEYYQKAIYQLDRRTTNFKDWMNGIVNLFEKAAELDPDFTLAYKGLAACYRRLYWNVATAELKENYKSLAKENLQKAINLDAESPEVMLEQGWHYYQIERDFEKALETLNRTKFVFPNSSELYLAILSICRRSGKWNLVERNIDKILELNPFYNYGLLECALTYNKMREFSKAENLYLRVNELDSTHITPYIYRSIQYFKLGQYDEVLELSKKPLLNSSREFQISWIYSLIGKGNYEEALNIISQYEDDIFFESHIFYYPRYYFEAMIYYLQNDKVKAKEYALLASQLMEERLKLSPNNHRLLGRLAIIYAIMGQKELAVATGEKAMELLPLSKDAMIGDLRVVDMINVHIINGDYDNAIYGIDLLLSRPSSISIQELMSNAKYKPLYKIKKFQEMIKKYETQENENYF